MKQNARSLAAVLVTLGMLAGCSNAPDLGASEGRKDKKDEYEPPAVDAGLQDCKKDDKCKVEEDAGVSPPEVDAGQPVDAYVPPVDAYVPPVDAYVPPPICTLTPGYWKNHPYADAWDELFDLMDPDDTIVFCGDSYTQQDLIDLLGMPTRGDASITLARHLIAAFLNGAFDVGGTVQMTAEAACDYIEDADGPLPLGIGPHHDDRAMVLGWASILGSFNEGELGFPHCD